jgi:hypothetical protein
MSRLESDSRRSTALPRLRILAAFGACVWLASCAPTVGSPRWCEAMKQKPRGDWTANEALDFARHCVLANNN